MELAIPIVLVAIAFTLIAWLGLRGGGGFKAPDLDTDEHDVLAGELVKPRAEGSPLPPWPEWPVTREHGDRQPQARNYKASR